MPTETKPFRHEHYAETPSPEATRSLGVSGLSLSAMHFYKGAGEPYIGVVGPNVYRFILPRLDRKGAKRNETIGEGDSAMAALEQTLEGMRSLETIKTRSLAEIEMGYGARVDLTALEHYSPRMSPGAEEYPVPEQLKNTLLREDTSSFDTYERTTGREGWQEDVRAVVDEFMSTSPDGHELAGQLGIMSLDHLTPEQAVKLSVSVVQNLSKYTHEDMQPSRSGRPSRSDGLTTSELLREGIHSRDDPEWEGNGVCRNVTANVKVVFESLKATQSDMSMLNNTYATMDIGYNGKGYSLDRLAIGLRDKPIFTGHAWNMFTTVDKNGSAVATIIDATWVLEQDTDAALKDMDMTSTRAAAKLHEIVGESYDKPAAVVGSREYIDGIFLQGQRDGKSLEARRTLEQYTLSEYLQTTGEIAYLPKGEYLSDALLRAANALAQELSIQEIAQLERLDDLSDGDHSDRVASLLARARKNRLGNNTH